MLIVRGALSIGMNEKVEILSDPGVVALLKSSMERYRLSRSMRPGWAIPE